MIVRPKVNWLRMLFIWHGSVLQSILPQLLIMLLVSVLALLTHGQIMGEKVPLDTAPFTLVGVSLAIFLAFRNNASYDRYWEARKSWGLLLTAARSLTTQITSYAPQDDADFPRELFVNRVIALVYALKHQLRGTEAGPDLRRYLSVQECAEIGAKHYQPVVLLQKLRASLGEMERQGKLPANVLWMCDQQLNELSAVIATCERIANTPLPFAYSVLLHRTVYIYCFLLPFGLVDSIGAATPLIAVFVSYTLIALEAIASEISDPFGTLPNNLPLDALTLTIERSVLELNRRAMPAERLAKAGEGYLLR
jgi:putative membrane protein